MPGKEILRHSNRQVTGRVGEAESAAVVGALKSGGVITEQEIVRITARANKVAHSSHAAGEALRLDLAEAFQGMRFHLAVLVAPQE